MQTLVPDSLLDLILLPTRVLRMIVEPSARGIVATCALKVGELEITPVLQAVSQHPVKADVRYPNDADLSEMLVWVEKGEAAKAYRQYIAEQKVVDHAGQSVRTAHKQK